MAATFNFISDGVDKDLFTVASFSGTEGLSQLYRYEIQLKALTSRVNDLVDNRALDDFVDEILNHTARLVTKEDGAMYPVNGMLASFDENQMAGGYTYYTAVLVPRLWKLSIYRTNEIYTTEKTVDQIIETVLDQFDFIDGRDYALSLSSELMKKDYVCQFGETDFHFISRLMENEGIYYYFEQGEYAEKLMIVDEADYAALEKPDVIFDVNAQAARHHESLSSWSRRTQRLPAHVSARDYNPNQPSLDVHGTASVNALDDSSDLCEYLYGGNFSNENEAARLALLRVEEISCRKTRFHGEGAVCGFHPGYTFRMSQHPNEKYQAKDYLILEVLHEGAELDHKTDGKKHRKAGPQYHNSFVAMEAGLVFRPPLLTKKPRFFGTITAFIYSEAKSDMAEIDKEGRYRVLLPFDRSDGGKESSDPNRKMSSWVRMAQPFVGKDEGLYFPLKGGTEVLLTFINGDPDRPVISSALPNASTPPLLTEKTSTASIIQTGGDNKILMEDKKGEEGITIHSAGNLLFEARDKYAEYYLGKSNHASLGIQTLLNKIGDSKTKPSGLKNHNHPEKAVSLQGAINSAHVRVSDLDSFVFQKGYIYDFGPGANYNFGEAYTEWHTNQSAKLNDNDILGDLPNIGGPSWESMIWPTRSGLKIEDLKKEDTQLEGKWTNAHVWVEKKIGNTYDYRNGDSITVVKGDSLDIQYADHRHVTVKLSEDGSPASWKKEHEDGNSWERAWDGEQLVSEKSSVDGKDEETTWTAEGIKTSYSSSEEVVFVAMTSESSYSPSTGALLSYSTNVDSGEGGSASFDFALAAKASSEINLGAKASADINLSLVTSFSFEASGGIEIGISAGMKLIVEMGAAMNLKIEGSLGGDHKYDVMSKEWTSDLPFTKIHKAAELKAEREGMVLTALTSRIEKVNAEISGSDLTFCKGNVNLLMMGLEFHG